MFGGKSALCSGWLLATLYKLRTKGLNGEAVLLQWINQALTSPRTASGNMALSEDTRPQETAQNKHTLPLLSKPAHRRTGRAQV